MFKWIFVTLSFFSLVYFLDQSREIKPDPLLRNNLLEEEVMPSQKPSFEITDNHHPRAQFSLNSPGSFNKFKGDEQKPNFFDSDNDPHEEQVPSSEEEDDDESDDE